MIMPLGQTILAQAAGPGRMGRVMSIVGVPLLLAPIVGPVIGGALVDAVSWRWIFFVNLPVRAVAVLLLRLGAGPQLLGTHLHTLLGYGGLVAATVLGLRVIVAVTHDIEGRS
jgi:MFS family permease